MSLYVTGFFSYIKEITNMNKNQSSEDKPPILGSWNRMYIVVLVAHFVIISLFVFFTKLYS